MVILLKDIDYKAVGGKIRDCRRAKKITQEQLAEICDVSASYIGHIERGSRNLSMNTAIQICNALGVGLDYLFLDCAEKDDEVLNCIHSVLSTTNESQRKRFLNTVKILADNIDKM